MTELEAVPILGIFPDREKPLEVKIEIFEGPLELLLHMIRKKKVSIDEVRLSDLTAAYLDYIRALQSVDLDVAGEFLEIAFDEAGIENWEDYITIDPQFFRPAEVEVLRGDATKAAEILGWKPKTSFEQLVRKMVRSDLALIQQQLGGRL